MIPCRFVCAYTKLYTAIQKEKKNLFERPISSAELRKVRVPLGERDTVEVVSQKILNIWLRCSAKVVSIDFPNRLKEMWREQDEKHIMCEKTQKNQIK